MSWKSKLHPSVSKAEEMVFQELSRLGLTRGMVTQKAIILRMTIPDFMWGCRRKVVFLDGEQAHRGREEFDNEVTELLTAKDWDVLRIPYEAPLTKQRLVEVMAEIKEFLGVCE